MTTATLPTAASRRPQRRAPQVSVPRGLSPDEAERALSAIARGADAMLRSGQAVTLALRPAGAGSTARFVIVPQRDTAERETPARAGRASPTPGTDLARAYARGAAAAAGILAAPDMLSSDAMAERLGMTREAVHQKRRRGELLGLEGAKRGVRFPAWQIGPDGRPPAALPALLAALGEPWAAFRFLRATHPELGSHSGIAALHDPRLADQALALARRGATFGPAGA
ncbi:hypothetical protein [Roseomonas sp. CECT 9278]|uniref:hypothetical protein n=1 Tax=Roseomonas sp. CECT 9278 TaxID=2845823 RepID=UPI001E28B218|nr:hypothetical protein [Roseomonas sp. CECT 9278]CAH0305382.1 hypothetical protein ROS9278_04705 [Roseomonas sp. CECT 9278]